MRKEVGCGNTEKAREEKRSDEERECSEMREHRKGELKDRQEGKIKREEERE